MFKDVHAGKMWDSWKSWLDEFPGLDDLEINGTRMGDDGEDLTGGKVSDVHKNWGIHPLFEKW